MTQVSTGPPVQARSLYLLHEFKLQAKHIDSWVTDVLPDATSPTIISQVVNAYTCTRTPELMIATQGKALLVITWVSAIDELFRHCSSGGGSIAKAVQSTWHDKAVALAEVCSALTSRVKRVVEGWDFAAERGRHHITRKSRTVLN